MISQKMIDWGSQGCGIREIARTGVIALERG